VFDNVVYLTKKAAAATASIPSTSSTRQETRAPTASGFPAANAPLSTVPIGYDSVVTGLQGMPATDGLRNITGRVNSDGSATIWAVT
jgi:hypothetical protein